MKYPNLKLFCIFQIQTTVLLYIKLILTLLITILTFSNISAQSNCLPTLLSSSELETSRSDSAWLIGLNSQINHYVALRKEIIPKYWNLKKNILNQIDKEDFARLNNLKEIYLKQVESYQDEMRTTNARAFKNLRPSGEISNLLVFETFRAFPDTWAMLINPTVINRNVNHLDVVIIDELYKKYNSRLNPFQDCINQFKGDREVNLSKNWAPFPFQGIKTIADSQKCSVADLLLWIVL